MQIILLVLAIGAVVVLLVSGVVSYFNSGARKYKMELQAANERVSIAQTALIEIASGDAMPVLRASDALSSISKSYNKELN